MRLFKWFKINGEDREFKLYWFSRTSTEILQCIDQIKSQGDLYHITKSTNGVIYLWDARP